MTAAGGGGPVSALIAGWAASATTPAATWAASLLGGPSADPSDDVFPTLVLAAFLTDVSGGSGSVSSGAGYRLVASSGYCAEVSAYLSARSGRHRRIRTPTHRRG